MFAAAGFSRRARDGLGVGGFVFLSVALVACGGTDHPVDAPPVASSINLMGEEDTTITASLVASDPEGQPVTYEVTSPPTGGSIVVDASTGVFSYQPLADFNGSDRFTYIARNREGAVSPQAAVVLTVIAVNDPPSVAAMPDAANSAHVRDVRVPLDIDDVDGDDLTVRVDVEDPTVAEARVDANSRGLVLTPLNRGTTAVEVIVSDGVLETRASFDFLVTDATVLTALSSSSPETDAIRLVNAGDRLVEFSLGHNGFKSFASLEEIFEHVRGDAESFPGEPFERKLWRFIRDSVAHDLPLTGELWIHDPLIIVNSLGWGICSGAALAYAHIARAAGYESRVWELSGHIVPEVQVDAAWQMYDADLAVYYHRSDGAVASVDDLQSNPLLITNPVDPIFSMDAYPTPYQSSVADIYSTQDDNRVAPEYLQRSSAFSGRVQLPPGGTLTYPGRWDVAPIGYDGSVVAEVESYLHALLTLPPDFQGVLTVPWLLRKIAGAGEVRVADRQFTLGDPALDDFLQQPGGAITAVEVLRSDGPVELIMYVNALRFGMQHSNDVSITSVDAWAIEMETVTLPESARIQPGALAFQRKPLPEFPESGS